MSKTNSSHAGGRSRESHSGLADAGRRVAVIIAALAGLFGILAGQPVVAVAWRTAVVVLIAWIVIHLFERALGRMRTTPARSTRGGTR